MRTAENKIFEIKKFGNEANKDADAKNIGNENEDEQKGGQDEKEGKSKGDNDEGKEEEEDDSDDESDGDGNNKGNEEGNTDIYGAGVSISPDGTLVAAACLDHLIRIWDIKTGHLVEILRGHSDCVYCVTFTADGKSLFSGGFDNMVKHWDLTPFLNRDDCKEPLEPAAAPFVPSTIVNFRVKESGDRGSTCITNLAGHEDLVLGVVISPDGRWVISGSKDRSVIFWDARTGEMQVRLRCHFNSVVSLAMSPSGGTFATGSGDFCAKICEYLLDFWYKMSLAYTFREICTI